MATPTIIADIGSNHNQDPERTMELIKQAKDIGCDAVKFQLFDERLARGPISKMELTQTKLTTDLISRIYHGCKDAQIPLHCSVFHPDLVDFLDPFVEEFKIGSYEILWLDLIRTCAKTRKPLGISTGGATAAEVVAAYRAAREYLPSEFITLYHCDPHYPAQPENANLKRMHALREFIWPYNSHQNLVQPIGYSDHTRNHYVMVSAAVLGASDIEFHLDLPDMEGRESRYGHVWDSNRAKHMILDVRDAMTALTAEESVYDLTQREQRTDPTDGARPLLKREEPHAS